MLSSVALFEHATNNKPFYSGSSATTKYFDPTGSNVFWIPNTCLATAAASIVVVLDGTTLVRNTDYFLYPDDGPPFSRIEFAFNVFGDRRSLAITSVFAVQTTLSGDVNHALLSKGALIMGANAGGTGVAARLKQGPVEIDGSTGTSQFLKDCDMAYAGTVARYRRQTL